MNLEDPLGGHAAPGSTDHRVYSFMVGALDSIRVGVIAADRYLRPVHFNRYARDVLEQGAAIGLLNGTLTCPQPSDASRLRLAVVRCIDDAAAAPVVFRLYDQRRAEYLEVAIQAARDAGLELASIFIRSSAPQADVSDVLLAELYGLTRAERQIASLLTQEGSVTVAAKVRGVSASTARTHLRSLLRKTGARRQVDLVQRLSTGLCGLVRFCAKDGGSPSAVRRERALEERVL